MPASRFHSNTRLSTAVASYLARIESQGLAPSSQQAAVWILGKLQSLVATKKSPDPFVHLVTPSMLEAACFGPGGLRVGVTASSFNRYRSTIQQFFKYAHMMGWTDKDPSLGVAYARPDAARPRLMLNASELLGLLEHSRNPVERIALSLGMNTGMRANDIRHLTVFDASLASGTIQTEIRKTKGLDVKPITLDLHRELKRWLDFYADVMGLEDRGHLPNDWFLVPSYHPPAPNQRDRRITPRPMRTHSRLSILVQRPLARMGYPTKGEGFHTLRRSSARALFESLRDSGEGRDHALMIVKDFLNHRSTAMTEHYLGLNNERAIRDKLLKDRPFLSVLAEKEQERVMPNIVTPALAQENAG